MIVEDELIVSKNLEQRLIEAGFNVIAAANSGEEALELCKSITPDLILMDIKLSGSLDGIETAHKIKQNKDIPVIYLTAFADDEILDKAKLTDPFGYLLKPFDVRDLKKTIEIALYKHNLEKKLKQSEEKFRILFDYSPLGNVVFSLSGEVVDVNPALAQMLGFSKEELIEKNIWHWFPFLYDEIDKDSNLNGKIIETTIKNPFGNIVWIRVTISQIYLPHQDTKHYLALVEDITIKTQNEELLKESETRLRRMVENLPAGAIYIADNMFYYNKEVEKITGYMANEIKNLDDWFAKLYPENTDEIKQYYLNDRQTGFQNPRIVEITRKDKSKRFVEFIAHLFISDEVWIFSDITDRVNAEEEILRSRDQLKKLSEYLQSAREEERAAIAREVHDDLGQSLTALKMDIVWLKKNRNTGENVFLDKLNGMVDVANQSIKTIQRLGQELRPKLLDDIGLISALEWQAGEFQKRFGIPCKLNSAAQEINLDKKIGLSIFRIFQEALTNVARHSNATEVNVNINYSKDMFLLSIKDNGIGIPSNKLESNSSIGIIGMKERADLAGGKVEFFSDQRKGTEVRLTIPISQEN